MTIHSPIILPRAVKGWVSRDFALGTASYDLDSLYSPDTGYDQSKVLDLASPKFEPNKTYIFDKSGKNNHGTITGATWVRLPRGLWVQNFDGDDYVTLPNNAFSTLTAFTLEMWFNPTSLVANQFLWSTFVDATNQVHVQMTNGDGTVQLYVIAGGTSGIQWQTANLVAGQRTHLVFTYPAVGGQNARCWQNGVEKTNEVFGSKTLANSVSFANLVGTQVNRIGQQNDASFFVGTGGVLTKLFNSVLTPTTIVNHYNQERHLSP